jgi:hypothetical protein
MTDSMPSWEHLAVAWRAEEAPVSMDEIHATLRVRRRASALVVTGELGITAMLIGFTVQTARVGMEALDLVFLSGIWLFWLVATVFAWWNRRGQWRPEVRDTGEFIRLSLQRAGRKVLVAWFSLGLLLVQVVFGTGLFIANGRTAEGEWGATRHFVLWLILILVSYGSWIVWYYRRARREQAHFRSMGEAMGAVDA